MKLFILIVLLISGAFGSNSAEEGMNVMQPLVSEAPPLAAAVISIEGKSAAEMKRIDNSSNSCKDQPITAFNHVAGVSLYDTQETIVMKLGQPEKIEQDEIWSELNIYSYPSVRVAFYGEQVQYVDVPAAEYITINDTPVPMTEEGLKACLGQPDFTAEDGIVFVREEAVLKLFIDESTRQPLYASFYHIATV